MEIELLILICAACSGYGVAAMYNNVPFFPQGIVVSVIWFGSLLLTIIF